jgi:proteasome accessory factor B
VAGQSPAERLFTITCCLMAAPSNGLTKQALYQAVPGYQSAENNEARERMFERDKKDLRAAGVQLEAVQIDGDIERYVIAKGTFDWPKDFKLTPEQLGLVEIAAKAWNTKQFAQSARTALARLKSLGYVDVSRELSYIAPRLVVKHKAFLPLAEAIDENKTVAFDYRVPGDQAKTREVNPLRLRLIEGEWVLLAQRGSEIRNYLLRRIIGRVKNSGVSFPAVAQEVISKAEEDLVKFTKSNRAVIEVLEGTEGWWHFGEMPRVELTFMDEELLAEDLLEFGSEITVLEPQSLITKLKGKLERVVSQHA